jgi:hypothetical protein
MMSSDRTLLTIMRQTQSISEPLLQPVGGQEAQALITIYKDCKMMLLPIPSHQILVGFLFERSANAEDDNIANEIERLVADTVIK